MKLRLRIDRSPGVTEPGKEAMDQRLKVYVFLFAIVGLLVAGYLLNTQFHIFNSEAQAANPLEAGDGGNGEPAVPVRLAPVSQGRISSFIDATGNLRALRDVEIGSQVEGIVHKVLAEEGDFVQPGQLLVKLDDAQRKINLELARERLAQARIQVEKAQINREKAAVQIENIGTEVERYTAAHESGLVSETEVASRQYQLDDLIHDRRASESEIKELGHRVAELEAEIEQSELQISLTAIKAPFAGYITERMVELGQRVRSLDPLFKLGSFSPLYTDIFLSEREAREIRTGQEAALRLGMDDGGPVVGTVKRISPVVDQATGTVKVTVEVETEEPGFKPGAFVRVAVQTDTRSDALLIPKSAVLEQDGVQFVFVVDGDHARRVRVVTGYEQEGLIQIRSGLTAGERVVVAGQGALKEGKPIKVIG